MAFAVFLCSCQKTVSHLMFLPDPGDRENSLYVHFIDVWQGDAILITNGQNRAVLIDAGLPSQSDMMVRYLNFFGVEKIDWLQSEYNQLVVVLLFLWKSLGYNMILFMAALSNIPRELLEVADVEGAGPVYKLFAIKLRYLSPTLLFVTILSLINSFKVFREAYLLTGDYPYGGLYMLQHFMNNIFRSLDYQRLAAAAVTMAVAMVIIIAVLFLVENRYGKDVEG